MATAAIVFFFYRQLLFTTFDTQVAASILGESALGLQALLEGRLGLTLSKKFQRADWAERPLSDGMLDYAAADTRHLMKLADMLVADREELNAAIADYRAELGQIADSSAGCTYMKLMLPLLASTSLTPRSAEVVLVFIASKCLVS